MPVSGVSCSPSCSPWHLQCQKWYPVCQVLSKYLANEIQKPAWCFTRLCLKTIKQCQYSSRLSICFMITKLDMFIRENSICQKKAQGDQSHPEITSVNPNAIHELVLCWWPQPTFWSTEVSGKMPWECFFNFYFVWE